MPGGHLDGFGLGGQQVQAGDVLLTIESMKMETALHAEKDGTIAEVLTQSLAGKPICS
nr:biotin/lipoyl-containing protein [Rhizobium lentis]